MTSTASFNGRGTSNLQTHQILAQFQAYQVLIEQIWEINFEQMSLGWAMIERLSHKVVFVCLVRLVPERRQTMYVGDCYYIDFGHKQSVCQTK